MHHRFAYARSDASGESRIVPTKSLLVHDLAHFAFESEAGLTRSFHGLLASGYSLADVSPERTSFPSEEARLTERIVGPLTGVLLARVTPGDFLSGFRRFQETSGEPMPDWLTASLIEKVVRRFRAVHGEWKATPFHATLRLVFDPRTVAR